MSPQPPDDQHNWQQNTAKPELGQWFYTETVPGGQGAGTFNIYPQADGTLIKEFVLAASDTPVPASQPVIQQVVEPVAAAAMPAGPQTPVPLATPETAAPSAQAPPVETATGQPTVITAGPVHAAWGSTTPAPTVQPETSPAETGNTLAPDPAVGAPAGVIMQPANAAQIAL